MKEAGDFSSAQSTYYILFRINSNISAKVESHAQKLSLFFPLPHFRTKEKPGISPWLMYYILISSSQIISHKSVSVSTKQSTRLRISVIKIFISLSGFVYNSLLIPFLFTFL